MRKKKILIGAGILAVVVTGVAVMGMRGRGETALTVQTGKVSREKIVQKVNGTGKIQPKTQVKISADVSAKITKLAVVEGQWVEKGTFLLELDRERYLALVESAEANVRSAEAEVKLVQENLGRAEKEFNRSKELKGRDLESTSIYEDREAAYQVELARFDSVKNQVSQARAALKQARDDLSKTTIYAPMAGTISALNKEQGEIAIGSQFQPDVILIIADLAAMEAQINVDENDIVSVAIGQEAEIEVDALPDQKLKGVVSEIASSANSSGVGTTDQKTEFEVKITVTNPPETLRPGMTATADVFTKQNESALSVPIQSVAVRTVDQLTTKGQKREEAEKVFTADKDGFVEIVFCIESGKAVAKQVKTGIQSDDLIEITEGLAEGEEVVTGSYRAISKDIENGATVTVNNEEKPEAKEKTEQASAGE